MQNIFKLANDHPKLSQRDLDIINRAHCKNHDHAVLKKYGLGGMEKMEDWGIP